MSLSIKSFFLGLLLLTVFQNASATHIVGGDLQYRCLGNDQYELRLTMLRDCENGNEEADYDDPANIWIYDENYNPLPIAPIYPDAFRIDFMGSDTLFDISQESCLSGIPGILCVEITEYRDTVTLPYRVGGYRLAYQRCCRNTLIQNIYDPLETGATYELYITDQALEVCNEGPDIKDFPDLYTCLDEEFTFDQSSYDAEGDEIIYSLCTPNQGATIDRPLPYNVPDAPFDTINWITPPYSLSDMMGNPANPVTITSDGFLSGTPNKLGTYLVGFCVEEYRNGVLLSRSNRDFEITILPCGDIPQAKIDAPPVSCDGPTVTFGNNSENSTEYKWYFDYEGDTTLQLTEFEPTITYPDTGCYKVALIATLDGSCYDTVYHDICVYNNSQLLDFDIDVSRCDTQIDLVLTDLSTDTASTIIKRNWTIEFDGDQYTETGASVSRTFDKPGLAVITLTIESANGCIKSLTKEADLKFINLVLVSDSTSICKGESTHLIIDGDPDLTYTIEPDVNIDYSVPHDPQASPEENTTYIITATDGFCVVTDSAKVEVRGSDFEIVDLSDTCDINKVLTVNRKTYSEIKWSLNPDFNPVLSTEDTLNIEVGTRQVVYVHIVDTAINCDLVASYEIIHSGLFLDTNGGKYTFCAGDSSEITITNQNSLEWTIVWTRDSLILSDLNKKSITVDISKETSEYLYFIATAENGCITSDSILLEVIGDNVDIIDLSDSCDINKILTTNLSGQGTIEWSLNPDFDPVISTDDTLNYEVRDKTTFYVRVILDQGDCEVTGSYELIHAGLDLDFQGEYELCEGDDGTITVENSNSLDWEILWDSNPYILTDLTGTTITVYTDSVYTTVLYFTATAENGCTTSDSISVTVNQNDRASFTYDYECGSLMVQFTNTSETSDVSWDFGDGNSSTEENPKHTYVSDGTYIVTIKTTTGDCTDEYSDTIDIVLIEVNLPDSVYACDGAPVQLNPGGSTDYSYQWEPADSLDDANSANPTASISETTKFFVTITDADNPECELIDSVTAIYADINLNVSDDVRVCTTDSVTITATSNSGEIIWTDDQGNEVGRGESLTIKPGDSGFYTASVDVGDCNSTAVVNVTIYDLSDIIQATADPIEITAGDTVQLDVTGVNDSMTYEWSPSESLTDPANVRNPQARPLETTTYCVTVTDSNGCTGESCVTIEVLDNVCEKPFVYLPNAFSPNGDQKNDVLYVRGLDIDEMYLMIYNRWGEKVFESNDKNVGWDGTSNGEVQEDDVYGYYLRVKCFNGEEFIDKGNVSLLR